MPKGPRGIPEKPQDRKKVLIRLWGYLYRFKWMVLAALLLTVASNLFALVGPTLSGRAIDAIGTAPGGVDFPVVFYYCGLMIAFYLLSSLLAYILSVLMIRLSQKVVFQMREDVFRRLVELPVRYFDSHQTGDIISRISYDIDTVNASLSNDLLQVATSAITVVGSLVMMLAISPMLVLVFAVTIPISILFTRYMTRKVRPLFRKRSLKLGELNGFVEEIITGQKTIKAYHQEQTMTGRFDVKNKEAVDAYYNADYYGSMTGPSVNFINNLSLALISMFGALLFLFGGLGLGALSSFVLYSRKFSGPINDLNLRYEPLNLVAIVGPTGAGKTTIINLLMRFYDPDAGCIRLDGHEIRQVTRKSLRLAYAMVLQDTWLFHGTIFDNIAYGKKDASRPEVEAAAKAARIHSYITRLPEGYDTILNEDGMNISQGQKQLLTIARAMLLDANMLILDEATSNVDTRTEIQIQEAMRALMRGKTCFVIAHRLSTIQNADTILVVRDGDIVEQGNHQSLMESGGIYAELYCSQFQ